MEWTLAASLRVLILAGDAALRSLGTIPSRASGEIARWDASTQWWWLECHESVGERPTGAKLRAAIEAAALLNALACVDRPAFTRFWEEMFEREDDAGVESDDKPPNVVVGLSYMMAAVEDLEPLARAMLCGQVQPSPALHDGIEGVDFRVPLRLVVSVTDDELPCLFQQLLQLLVAQQALFEIAHSESTVRLEIRYIEYAELFDWQMPVAALPFLTQLMERGVHVPFLPALDGDDETHREHHARAQSLRRLFVQQSSDVATNSSYIEHVFTTGETRRHLHAGLYSALQCSQHVKSVDMRLEATSLDPDQEDRDDHKSMWRWTAYALFSRQAAHKIQAVTIHDGFLTGHALDEMEAVVRAENPLAVMFEGVTETKRWITASRFFLENPSDATDVADRLSFEIDVPLTVRAMSKVEHEGVVWWRVLLPGCGKTWVRDEESTAAVVTDDHTIAPLHFSFSGISLSSLAAARTMLLLIPHLVRSITIGAFGMYEDDFGNNEQFDLTDWISDILDGCSSLEQLVLPLNTSIQRLSLFVDRAVVGDLRLRELTVSSPFETDGSDILDFLDVLSDMSHPLTRQLEKISLNVVDPPRRTTQFQAAWKRMLELNRRLHTISLVIASEYSLEHGSEQDVAIRTAPLDLACKLAFLSVVQDPSHNKTASRRDATVMTNVFEFAAQHRLRRVHVEARRLVI